MDLTELNNIFHQWAKMRNAVITAVLLGYLIAVGMPCASAALDGAPEEAVEQVQVHVVTQDPPSSRVVKRMSESVKVIGEHILLGRKVIEVAERRDVYEKLVRDIFDRVLVGYTIDGVQIEPGATAKIQITLLPWGDTVREVDVRVDYSGIASEAVPLVQADMGRLTEAIQGALVGLPVDSVDWASGIARDLIREMLKQKLPEFHFSLDVEAGRQAKVRLSLFPVGELVKNVSVSMRSNTIPNLLLVSARPAVETQARSMRGLPVAYVARHMNHFKTEIARAAQTDHVIKQFDLKVASVIKPGVDTEAVVTAEAETWRITAEAYLDVGRNTDNISGQAHIGRSLGKYDELFLELKVVPGPMSWEIMPGWGHQFGSETWAGARFRTNDKEWVGWLQQGLGGRWSIRAEHWPHLAWTETRLRYKLHDFLSAEFVITNTTNWLRLVGHL